MAEPLASRYSRSSIQSRIQQINAFHNDAAHALVDDFKALYREHILCDFELVSGGVTFPVHKAILYARSRYFKSLFAAKVITGNVSSCDSLEVTDVDPHTLNRTLLFIYTSILEADLHLEGALKLYCAAHKFEVDSLKRACANVLQGKATVPNVTKILSLAHKHEDNELKAFVQDFMLLHFDEIIFSSEWEHFLEVDSLLAAKTLQLLMRRKIAEERRDRA